MRVRNEEIIFPTTMVGSYPRPNELHSRRAPGRLCPSAWHMTYLLWWMIPVPLWRPDALWSCRDLPRSPRGRGSLMKPGPAHQPGLDGPFR